MHLHKLTFQGIGPFVQRQELDFTSLGADGLFLLTGPTGSGKTTIIDAIVFALYADVAGGTQSDKSRLVSTFSASGVEPFVELVFESQQGLLKVRRTPEFERPKSRGTGTTTQKATCQIWKLADLESKGVLTYTNVQEANTFLADAVGLNKAQFTQTVVLPQGQFADFLKSTSDDRAQVLESIFGTEFYTRFMNKLKALSADKKHALDSAQSNFDNAATRFYQLAWDAHAAAETDADSNLASSANLTNHTNPTATPSADRTEFVAAREAHDTDTMIRLAHARVSTLTQQNTAVGQEVQRSTVTVSELQKSLDQAKRLLELRTRQAALHGELASLEAAVPDIAANKLRLERAQEAARMRPFVQASAVANQDLATAIDQLRKLRTNLASGANADLSHERWDADSLAAEAKSLHEAIGSLDHWVQAEQNLPKRRQTADEWSAESDRLRLDLDTRHNAIQALNAELIRAQTELENLAQTPQALLQTQQRFQQARQKMDAWNKVEQLSTALAIKRVEENQAMELQRAAELSYETRRVQWLNNLAGTLADGLADGSPCPVCGAKQHPALATPPPSDATKTAVDSALKTLESAREVVKNAHANSAVLATQLSDARSLAEPGNSSLASAELDDALTAFNTSETAAKAELELRQQLKLKSSKLASQQKDAAEVGQQLAVLESQLASLRAEIDEQTQNIAEQAAGFQSVTKRQNQLTERVSQTENLTVLIREVGNKTAIARQQDAELGKRWANSTLSAQEFESAILDQAAIEKLSELIENHTQRLQSVRQQLGATEFAGLADLPDLDVPAAEQALAAATTAQIALIKLAERLNVVLNAATATLAELEKAHVELSQQTQTAAAYVRMSELASAGQGNEAKVTLPTFVLIRRFAEVIDLANMRLEAMTHGRYQLRRTDAREGRERKVGLGLEIVDHETLGDQARNPRTLSGGETFQTSLALALGLADAVAAEAGGVELNTIFIDEGFGTLDDAARDEVMAQLDKLREGGRNVGLVSHVAELRQRITSQIIVRKNDDGTSTISTTLDD